MKDNYEMKQIKVICDNQEAISLALALYITERFYIGMQN